MSSKPVKKIDLGTGTVNSALSRSHIKSSVKTTENTKKSKSRPDAPDEARPTTVTKSRSKMSSSQNSEHNVMPMRKTVSDISSNEELNLSSKTFSNNEAEEDSEGTTSTSSNEIVEVIEESVGSEDSVSDEEDDEGNSFICDDDSEDDIQEFTHESSSKKRKSSPEKRSRSKTNKFNKIEALRDSADDQGNDDDNSDIPEDDANEVEITDSAINTNDKLPSSSHVNHANISPVCQVKFKSTNVKKFKKVIDTSVGYQDSDRKIKHEKTGTIIKSSSTFNASDYQNTKVIISKNILKDIEAGVKCKLYDQPVQILKPENSITIIKKLPVDTSLYSKLSKRIMEKYVQSFCSKISDGDLCVNISLTHIKPSKTDENNVKKTEDDIVTEFGKIFTLRARLKYLQAKKKRGLINEMAPKKPKNIDFDNKECKTEKRPTSQGKSCLITSYCIPENTNPSPMPTPDDLRKMKLRIEERKRKQSQRKHALSKDIVLNNVKADEADFAKLRKLQELRTPIPEYSKPLVIIKGIDKHSFL